MKTVEHPHAPIVVTTQQAKGLGTYVFYAGAAVAAFFGGRHMWRKWQEYREGKDVDDDPNARVAGKLQKYLDQGFLKSMFINRDPEILDLAKEIQDWDEVMKSYKKLSRGGNLDADLRSALGDDNYQKFLNTFKFKKKDPKTGELLEAKLKFKAGDHVVAKSDVNIRKTPVIPSPKGTASQVVSHIPLVNVIVPAVAKKANIIILAKAGNYLGVATGRSEFDNSPAAGAQGVLFMEISIPTRDRISKPAEWLKVWVAASQVDLTTPEKALQMVKDKRVASISQAEYNAASTQLGGLADTNFRKEVVTIAPAEVLYPNMQRVRFARAGIVLGHYNGEMAEKCMNGKSWVQFRTIQDQIRWVDRTKVKLLDV